MFVKGYTSTKPTAEDNILDTTLRPQKWEEYFGQEKVKRNLAIIIEAARKRHEPPEHLLFYGSSGLGKTTLAHLVAQAMGTHIKVVSGPSVEKAGDLAAILTNLTEGDVLFVDECHRINKICEEYLYSAMEDFKLNLIMGRGPMAQTMELKLPRFTLIGATTRMALLSAPLRNRFGATFQLSFYGEKDIQNIIRRSSLILNVPISEEAMGAIAKRSRLTPRVANRLLKRVRDFAQVENQKIITTDLAKKSLDLLEVDEKGLEHGDRTILQTIIERFSGGPVGLQALAATTSEEEDTILDIYEPYLMQLGFIERTPRGRIATKLAFRHLGIPFKGSQKLL